MTSLHQAVLVGVGGALGSLARYGTALAVGSRGTGRWPIPIATLTVNMVGCFLIGAVVAWLERRGAAVEWRLFLVVGFLGGFTTFSSFAYEVYLAAQGGLSGWGAGYAVASVALGYGAVWLGASLMRLL